MSLNQLPSIGTWATELSALPEGDRAARLEEMVQEVKAQGGCGSRQTSSGLPCRRPVKIGYPVCRKHGERAPATMAKAERLLAVARMPALEWMLDALDQAQENICDACGYPRLESLKYLKRIDSIARILMDRTGMGPRATIDLVAKRLEDQVLDVSALTDEEFEELGRLLAEMDRFKRRVRERQGLAPDGGQSPAGLLPSPSSND